MKRPNYGLRRRYRPTDGTIFETLGEEVTTLVGVRAHNGEKQTTVLDAVPQPSFMYQSCVERLRHRLKHVVDTIAKKAKKRFRLGISDDGLTIAFLANNIRRTWKNHLNIQPSTEPAPAQHAPTWSHEIYGTFQSRSIPPWVKLFREAGHASPTKGWLIASVKMAAIPRLVLVGLNLARMTAIVRTSATQVLRWAD